MGGTGPLGSTTAGGGGAGDFCAGRVCACALATAKVSVSRRATTGGTNCASSASLEEALVSKMLDVMPSHHLINHEWVTHGSCSGLSPVEYFAKTRAAHAALHMPVALKQPRQPISSTRDEIAAMFMAANPGLLGDMMSVHCQQKVSEVRICLDKELKFRRCGQGVHDVCEGTVFFPPTR